MFRLLLSQKNLRASLAKPNNLHSQFLLKQRAFSSVSPSFYTTACGLHIQKDLPKPFEKILIANRGEITCRIIRTARELGVKTVAIYSDADVNAQHVQMADEAYRVGGPLVSDSYLKMDRVIEIAKRSNAQAIHPGYGFLSENPKFASLCVDHNIEFIGPPPQAMRDMGDKSASKRIMERAQVPIVPGFHGADQSFERFKEEAEKMGYPVMLKAVAGGGGRGIRAVFDPKDLRSNFDTAKAEALRFFANGDLLIEKFVEKARHIEFQVFADKHGNGVHLFERDCSVQRGNQKVFEESPAPGLSEGLRNKMGQSAVDAALAVRYVGAGTVEFLFDPDTHKYYFMEMNTRLQVEHPVTEMIVKRDLVQWQLHAAAGHVLPAKQTDLKLHGHSIEARIYAEDPFNNFSSSSGKLHYLRFPKRVPESVRVETGVRQGDVITPYYDSMIAKVIAHSDSSRKDALLKLHQCLGDLQVSGISTNIEFLKKALIHPKFLAGGVTTNFIPTNRQDLLVPEKVNDIACVVAALSKLFITKQTLRKNKADMKASHVWYSDDMIGFTTTGAMQSSVDLVHHSGSGSSSSGSGDDQNQRFKVKILFQNQGPWVVSFGNKSWEIENVRMDADNHLDLQLKDAKLRYQVVSFENNVTVFIEGKRFDFEYPDYELQFESAWEKNLEGWVMPDLSELDAEVAKVLSTIECDVKNVNVSNGATVKAGDVLAQVEAMKTIHDIKAKFGGVVTDLNVKTGQHVARKQLLMKIKRSEK